MSTAAEGLHEQLENNAQLWDVWCEHGADASPIKIDWEIYPGRETDLGALKRDLEAHGFACDTVTRRFLILFTTTDFLVWSPKRVWTRDDFLGSTKELYELSSRHGATLDGCGAEMPGPATAS